MSHLSVDLRLRLWNAAEQEAVRVFATNLREGRVVTNIHRQIAEELRALASSKSKLHLLQRIPAMK